MSITSALNNALSGLSASARSAQITASNISNALTPGYGRRSLELSSQVHNSGAGVRITGTMRHVEAGLLSDRRIAEGNQQEAQVKSDFHARLETLVGLPGEAGSLNQRFADFESAIISAASRPDQQVRLDQLSDSAEKLTSQFRDISSGIQTLREDADRSIAQMVDHLNKSLARVQELNVKIAKSRNSPDGALPLIDHRQTVIDEISNIVPVRVINRDSGAIALFSAGGAVLLDGPAPTLDFTQTTTVQPHFSLDNGLLSGITINGSQVNVDPLNGPLMGGELAAQFAVRDMLSTEAQTTLDGIAAELVSRTQNPSLDASLSATDAGLFTDAGSFYSPTDETGLAGRISVNALVSQSGSNETWRLRDGLMATSQGALGNASLLNALQTTLNDRLVPSSTSLGAAPQSLIDLSTTLSTQLSSEKYAADQDLSYLSNHLNTLKEKELAQGVDSDQELQKLLLVEQSYAANAKVIQTVDDLIETLLRI